MPLIRRCPHCKSVNLGEKRVSAKHKHGGLYWAIFCNECQQALERFDLVDSDTGKVTANVSAESENMCVNWRKKYRDSGCKLSGRDENGMAI